MTVQLADWVISGFFLIALLLVLKLSRQIGSEGKGSYNHISIGLLILMLVAIARVYKNAGLFVSIPFLSEPVFYQLIIWIAVITGATFVVSGVSTWLPVSRAYRKYNKTKIDHLEFLKKMEQLVGVESRLDSVLRLAVDHMVEHFSFRWGMVFKYSPRQDRLVLTSLSKNLPFDPAVLNRIAFSQQGWQKHLNGTPVNSAGIITGLGGSLANPDMVLPICVDRQPVGFFLLWRSEETVCDCDDESNLRIAADIIARKIEIDRTNLRQQSLIERDAWRAGLEKALDKADGLDAEVSAIARKLGGAISADFVSLTLMDEREKKCRRVSVGESGTALVENGLAWPEAASPVGRAYGLSELVVMDDIRFPGELIPEGFLAANGLKSLIALPLRTRRIGAVLTLASKKTAYFNSLRIGLTNHIKPTFKRLLQKEETRVAVAARKRCLTRLNRFISQVHSVSTLRSTCSYAARLLQEELGAELVRVSILDMERNFLESMALVSDCPAGGMVPGDGTMILSLMPLHEKVIKTGRAIQITETGAAESLTEVEVRQVFTDPIRMLSLVPISVGDRVEGIVSLAGTYKSVRCRFDQEEQLFAATVAELLSLAIRLSGKEPARLGMGVRSSGDETITLSKSQFRNSSRLKHNKARLNRSLSTIDRSALKIQSSLQEENTQG